MEDTILSVDKSQITGENAFNEDIFDIEETTNQVKTKNLGFRYFWRFVTGALTLRPRIRYIYVF